MLKFLLSNILIVFSIYLDLGSSPVKTTGLESFNENLSKFSRFNSIRPLATLNYVNEHFNASNIVSR